VNPACGALPGSRESERRTFTDMFHTNARHNWSFACRERLFRLKAWLYFVFVNSLVLMRV
jgi:hypothetical protein